MPEILNFFCGMLTAIILKNKYRKYLHLVSPNNKYFIVRFYKNVCDGRKTITIY